jgi:hypothetical protein
MKIVDQTNDEKLAILSHILDEGKRSGLYRWIGETLPDDSSNYAYKSASGFHFPVHDPINILLSWTYLQKQADGLNPQDAKEIGGRILSNARIYGMDPSSFTKLSEVPIHINESVMEKIAEKVDAMFALEKDGVKFYPLNTEANIKEAIRYFGAFYKQLDPFDRKRYAKNVEKRASHYGISSGELITKYATSDVNPGIEAAIGSRVMYLNDESLKEAYDALSKSHSNVDPYMVMASLCDLDKKAELDGLWDTQIQDPAASIFSPSEKIGDEPIFESVSGDIYEGQLKEAIREGKLDDVLDSDTLRLLGDHPKEVLGELPGPVCEAVAQRISV